MPFSHTVMSPQVAAARSQLEDAAAAVQICSLCIASTLRQRYATTPDRVRQKDAPLPLPTHTHHTQRQHHLVAALDASSQLPIAARGAINDCGIAAAVLGHTHIHAQQLIWVPAAGCTCSRGVNVAGSSLRPCLVAAGSSDSARVVLFLRAVHAAKASGQQLTLGCTAPRHSCQTAT